ncbi:MAG TPA: type II toxin-antitoxin system HipA family toxin [Phycisphaerae bacterium]
MARTQKVTAAIVRLWDQEVGAVAWDADHGRGGGLGTFEYASSFARQNLHVAPITMPLPSLGVGRIFNFPELNRQTFRGLPGLLADALPDRFGNALIDLWLARHGRAPGDFSPVERLCYMGTRAMGALEFHPVIGPRQRTAVPIEVNQLADLAAQILEKRAKLSVSLKSAKADALQKIIQVGTSAGGARAKAVIAWNPQTHEVRSGQVATPPGFQHWLLKFDGANQQTLGEAAGFGRIEYAYHLMARAAGIDMTDCRLFEEGTRAHFMTRRFDRTPSGEKLHVQSLCAIGHYDFNAPGQASYEQAMAIIQQLNMGHPALEQLFRRMLFNVIARNQDDHTRNIAFLMNPAGTWSLAPAFDVIWSFNPAGDWTHRHQMRINGNQDDFTRADFLAVAKQFKIRAPLDILDQVRRAVTHWPRFADEAKIPAKTRRHIAHTHRSIIT